MLAGIQLHLPTHRACSLPELVDLARTAADGGVSQVWVTDNLASRNLFVVLTALAVQVPVRLGSAVLVQFFRNPVDVAGATAAIAEIMDGRELSIGMARGNTRTPGLLDSPKPVTMLRETARCLRALLAGEAVTMGTYPTLARYFNMQPGASFQLNFTPPGNVRLYCGANGPLGLAVGGAEMDGLVFGGRFQAAARSGKLDELMRPFDEAAGKAGKRGLPKVAEIKLSLARDGRAARQHVRSRAGSRLAGLTRLGYSAEHIAALGIDVGGFATLERAVEERRPAREVESLVTDPIIDAMYVAGDPGECRGRLAEIRKLAEAQGFEQLMFSELGPDPSESLRLLCGEVLPHL